MGNEEFNANLSRVRHELRTPLNHIIGYSEILLEDAKDQGADSLVPDLERVWKAGQSLLELIGDLLVAEKLLSGEMAMSADAPVVAPPVAEAGAALDLGGVLLSADLYARLHDAVDLHRISALRDCLDEMDDLGDAVARLAAHLRPFAQRYDMDSIKTVLQEVPHE